MCGESRDLITGPTLHAHLFSVLQHPAELRQPLLQLNDYSHLLLHTVQCNRIAMDHNQASISSSIVRVAHFEVWGTTVCIAAASIATGLQAAACGMLLLPAYV